MILYHGTTLQNAERILKDGIIKSKIERNYISGGLWCYKNTTDGYVYLTKNLYTAYYYGNINLIGIDNYKNKYVYVFKININDNILLPDYDEMSVKRKCSNKNLSVKESLEICGCVTVSNDVNINNSKYMILPGTGHPLEHEDKLALCRKLSKLQTYGGDVRGILSEIEEKFIWQLV